MILRTFKNTFGLVLVTEYLLQQIIVVSVNLIGFLFKVGLMQFTVITLFDKIEF